MGSAVYFDCEITLPEKGFFSMETAAGENIFTWDYPFHISCAAVLRAGSQAVVVTGEGDNVRWGDQNGYAYRLEKADAKHLLENLAISQERGDMLFTWNGTGFDFLLLGLEADDMALATKVCKRSYDPMFQLFCMLGYPVGLDAVAQGYGIPGKVEDLGNVAPALWEMGDCERVINYLKGDVDLLQRVVQNIRKHIRVDWVSKKGHAQGVLMRRFLTVEECLKLREPNVSWIENPRKRADIVEWFKETND